jgi:hypothetical protein
MRGESNIEATMNRLRLDVPQRFVLLTSLGAADALAALSERCAGKDASGWATECESSVLSLGTVVSRVPDVTPKASAFLGGLMEMIHLRWRCEGLDASGWSQYATRRMSDVSTALSNFVAKVEPSGGSFPKHPDAWRRWLREEWGDTDPETKTGV